MKSYLLGLAIAGLIGSVYAPLANNGATTNSNQEYIYGENIIPNGDFSVSAGEYVLPSIPPSSGVASKIGPIDPNPLIAIAEEGNENNTILKMSGSGFSSFYKLMDIQPGSTYNVSFDYKINGTTDNIGFAFWCTSLSNRIPETNIMYSVDAENVTFTKKENGWINAAVTRTFDANQTYDSMQLWANTNDATIYFDNFIVSKVGETENAFIGGDFEGFLDYAQTSISETPSSDGIYGKNAKLGSHCVKLSNDGVYGLVVDGLEEELYTLDISCSSKLSNDAKLVLSVANESTLNEVTIIENGEVKNFSTKFSGAKDATKIELKYTGSEEISINKWSIRPTYKNVFDPTKTYYESKNYVVNGDFEKFDVGTKFSEEQLEGAWGSVTSYDNGGRIVQDGDTKVAGIGKFDEKDIKNYSSMFLMTPDDITIGDLIRFEFDYKLTIKDDPSTYADLNFCLVGGANQSYYKIDFTKLGFNEDYSATSGVEDTHYLIKSEKLDNGYTHVILDFQVSSDKIQWNSARWLFTAHDIGDLLYVDNVAIKFLSETPYIVDVDSISLDCGDLELKVGDTKTINATVNPGNADDKTLTWSSSDSSVVKVENGTITALKEGVAEIIVEANNGVKTSIVVTVLAEQIPDKGQTNIGAIVGISIGAVCIIAGIITFVVIKKKKSKNK